MSNTAVIWKSYPTKGLPGEKECFSVEQRPMPSETAEGQLLVKLLYLSVDPYMRSRMRENLTGSYIGAFKIGEPLTSGCVAQVLESKAANFQAGDLVQGFMSWQQFQLLNASTPGLHKLPALEGVSPSHALGVLGLTGLTAYFGLLELTQPKSGETVVVSGAAGAVGQIVGQIAKIKGCRVVGIAGTEEKVKLLTEKYGYDESINYQVADTFEKMKAALDKACPKGIDVYFDNTGGYTSDAVVLGMNNFGRISVCGQISSYNEENIFGVQGPRTDFLMIAKQLKKEGFLVSRWASRFPEGVQQLYQWIREGKIVHDETIVEGIENAPRAFIELMQGKNIGKMIVKI